jgi:hypothetical protein
MTESGNGNLATYPQGRGFAVDKIENKKKRVVAAT